MKILITGGCGFIGLALARKLIGENHEVILVDNLSTQIHGALPMLKIPEQARFVRLDVREMFENAPLLEGCDTVFHLAAETGTAQSMYCMAEYVSVNVQGTASVLSAIGKCSERPRKFVLASSRSVYGEGAYESIDEPGRIVQPLARSKHQLSAGNWEPMDSNRRPLRAVATPESLGYSPGSVYAATKASQELLVQSAANALGLETIIFRFQNVYGEGQSLQNPYTGIISIFFNRARQGLEIPIYEDGFESRDFIHVSDIVSALDAALKADVPAGSVINLGSGKPTSVRYLAQTLLSVSRLQVPTKVTGQFRVGDIRHCYADLTVAKKLLGYEPQVELREGLSRFCEWAADQPVYEDRLSQATQELIRQGLSN